MAETIDKKPIREFGSATTINDEDVLLIDQSNTAKKISGSSLKSWILGLRSQILQYLVYSASDTPAIWNGEWPRFTLSTAYENSSSIWLESREMPLSNALVSDSGWTNMVSGSTAARYKRVNGFVVLKIAYGSNAPQGSSSPVGTLPSGLRPSESLYFPAYAGTASNSNVGAINIYSNGTVWLSYNTSQITGGQFYGTAVYPVGV